MKAIDRMLMTLAVLAVFVGIYLFIGAIVISVDPKSDPAINPTKAWTASLVWGVLTNAYIGYLNWRLDRQLLRLRRKAGR